MRLADRIGIIHVFLGVAIVAGCSGSSGNGDLTGAGDGGAPQGQGAGLGGGLGGGGLGAGAGKSTTTPSTKGDGGGGGGLGGSSTGGGECKMATGQPSCDACLTASCCAEVKACNANTSCNPLYACLSGCGADEDCASSCIDANAAGKPPLQVVVTCSQQKCSSECQ